MAIHGQLCSSCLLLKTKQAYFVRAPLFPTRKEDVISTAAAWLSSIAILKKVKKIPPLNLECASAPRHQLHSRAKKRHWSFTKCRNEIDISARIAIEVSWNKLWIYILLDRQKRAKDSPVGFAMKPAHTKSLTSFQKGFSYFDTNPWPRLQLFRQSCEILPPN